MTVSTNAILPSYTHCWAERDGKWWLVVMRDGEPYVAYHPDHGRIFAFRDTFCRWTADALDPAPASANDFKVGDTVEIEDGVQGILVQIRPERGDDRYKIWLGYGHARERREVWRPGFGPKT